MCFYHTSRAYRRHETHPGVLVHRTVSPSLEDALADQRRSHRCLQVSQRAENYAVGTRKHARSRAQCVVSSGMCTVLQLTSPGKPQAPRAVQTCPPKHTIEARSAQLLAGPWSPDTYAPYTRFPHLGAGACAVQSSSRLGCGL